MPARRDPLSGLVALKRQRAEQALASAQAGLAGLHADVARLETQLKALDHAGVAAGDVVQAYRHGCVDSLLGALRALHQACEAQAGRVDLAKQRLRELHFSEQQVGGTGPRRRA